METDSKIGKKIVEDTVERLTLKVMWKGCKNFKILKVLPKNNLSEICEHLKFSKSTASKCLTELRDANLVERSGRDEPFRLTKLGKAFFDLINNLKGDVIKEMSNLI